MPAGPTINIPNGPTAQARSLSTAAPSAAQQAHSYAHPTARTQQQQQQQGASGFRLQSLLKLREVRSHDTRSNLIHYLANMVASTNPELLTLPDQFSFLNKLQQYKTREILDQVLEHQKTLNKMRMFQQRLANRVEAIYKALKTPSGTIHGTRCRSGSRAKKRPLLNGQGVPVASIITTPTTRPVPTISTPTTGENEEGDGNVGGGSETEAVSIVDDTVQRREELATTRKVILKLDKWLEDAQRRYEDLVDLVSAFDISWKATAMYFGEKTAADVASCLPARKGAAVTFSAQHMGLKIQNGPRKPAEEIFAVIHEFFRNLKEAHQFNEEAAARARRAATPMKRFSSSSSRPLSSSSTNRPLSTTSIHSIQSLHSISRGTGARP